MGSARERRDTGSALGWLIELRGSGALSDSDTDEGKCINKKMVDRDR